MKTILLLTIFLTTTFLSFSQNDIWKDKKEHKSAFYDLKKNKNFDNSELNLAETSTSEDYEETTMLFDETTKQWVNSSKISYVFTSNFSINTTDRYYFLWDSNLNEWINQKHRIITRDLNGNLIASIIYNWDVNLNQWIGSQNFYHEYDSDGKILQVINSKWDFNINNWKNYDKDNFSYDMSGYLIEVLNSNWDDTTKEWVFQYKSHDFMYDSAGNETQEIISNWDVNLSQWVLYGKFSYLHDYTNNHSQLIFSFWDKNTNNWIYNSREDYVTNLNGERTEDIIFTWDLNLIQWRPIVKNYWTYDLQNNLTGYIQYQIVNNQFIIYVKNFNTYDSFGQLTGSVGYIWDENLNDFVGGKKIEKSYYSLNSISQEINYSWDLNLKDWVFNYKYDDYLYDSDGRLAQFYKYNWDISTNNWKVFSRTTYSKKYEKDDDYDGVANNMDICINTPAGNVVNEVGCSKNKIIKIIHYPNPFINTINFSFDLPKDVDFIINIYDQKGSLKSVLNDGFYVDNKIEISWNASNFIDGIYFYKLNVGGKEVGKGTILKSSKSNKIY